MGSSNAGKRFARSTRRLGNMGLGGYYGTGSGDLDGLYRTFGYQNDYSFEDYMRWYERGGIAKRIISATVDFTWKNMPEIVDDEAKKYGVQETEFEVAVYDLFNKMKLSGIFKRADTLACIGRYSVIVVGTKNESLAQPLGSYEGIDQIAFINVYSERQAEIKEYELNPSSPMYGYPRMYLIRPDIANESDGYRQPGAGSMDMAFEVDASRVIHIADEVLENELFGTPKLRAVMNYLVDLQKVTGGAAEMFWLSAYQGLAFNVNDGYELDEDEAEHMTEQIENYVYKLQRFLKLKGVTVQSIGSTVADPTGNFGTLVKLIAGTSNIPMRILLGSEQGQLAASVDQDTFFSYITSRRNEFAEETVIKPFVEKLVKSGILPKPKEDTYVVQWKELFEMTPLEKAKVMNAKIVAMKNAAGDRGVLSLATVEEIREEMGLKAEIPETNYGKLI